MKSATPIALIITSLLLISREGLAAQVFYVDVTNSTQNAQVHLPNEGDYSHYPSHDFTGPGFSAGSGPFSAPGYGTYYIADGFRTGITTHGLWNSTWLDALFPAPDAPPHGGLGTVDIITPGGISGAIGLDEAIIANGLPAAPLTAGDTNGHYLGIGSEGRNSEYALWETAMTVVTPTTFQYSYSWVAAGATAANGDELFPLDTMGMGAVFFLDTDMDYSNGIHLSRDSAPDTYKGAGLQEWQTVTGTITLEPGTYYWGFAAYGDGPAYIGVEGISIQPIPEPSGTLLAIGGVAGLMLRRRRQS